MSDTFTVPGIGSWSPVTTLSDPFTKPSRTIVHELIGTQVPDVTLRPGLLRKGEFQLLTNNAADAAAGLLVLSSGQPITLMSERAQLSMRFVVTEPGIKWETIAETRDLVVILSVPFQEVAP